ncbi:MAG: hypothetical protein KF716_31400 [Anaerolineae bacterium]|nr:hypothetical protein [Anaerolineae bacterium]
MTNSNDPWRNLLNAARNLEGGVTAATEAAFRDALQASLRQEQQRMRDQYGTDALALYHGAWQANNNRGAFTLKLGSQRDETLSTSIDLDQDRVATIFVDLSRANGQLIVHGQVVIAGDDATAEDDSWHGSEVTLYHPDGAVATTKLDGDGEFTFSLPGSGTFGLEILSHSGEVLQLDDITVET